MKKRIKGILDWHEDVTGVIPNNKFEWVVNEINDLFEMELSELHDQIKSLKVEITELELMNQDVSDSAESNAERARDAERHCRDIEREYSA